MALCESAPRFGITLCIHFQRKWIYFQTFPIAFMKHTGNSTKATNKNSINFVMTVLANEILRDIPLLMLMISQSNRDYFTPS